jgi:hypothetical protein
MVMSVSNIQSNVSALLNKAYNTETNTAGASDAVSTLAKETTSNSDSSTNASASAQVTLGSTDTAPETYTAKGLMQQLRQYQLSNASLIFGNGDDSSDDSTGLSGLTGTSSSSDLESMSQDWVSTISDSPGKASVMVESSKNESLNTIFGG